MQGLIPVQKGLYSNTLRYAPPRYADSICRQLHKQAKNPWSIYTLLKQLSSDSIFLFYVRNTLAHLVLPQAPHVYFPLIKSELC